MNIKIEEYASAYRDAVSNIVTRNMLEINSRDYGIEQMREHACGFTPEKIAELAEKGKIFVALSGQTALGTLRACPDGFGEHGDYVLLTIFVLPEYHSMGIGKLLMRAGEAYVKGLGAKKITIPASVTAHKFYHKLGYEYADGREPNSHGVILMNKHI